MKLADTGLRIQPFRTQGKPHVLVTYAAHLGALHFLEETCKHRHGLGLLHGPSLSGKTTIVQSFAASLPGDHAVAIIDGAHTDPARLLKDILGQFGYTQGFNTPTERFNMIRVVALQQASRGQAPVLVVEHVHQMSPVLLEMLCELAEIAVDGTSALRIVLVSDRSSPSVFQAAALQAIDRKLTGKFQLKPMTRTETATYTYKKLKSGGCREPKSVMPPEVCLQLHSASGGWPGIVDKLAMLALAKAERLPVQTDHVPRTRLKTRKPPNVVNPEPELILTCQGKTLKRIRMDRPQLLIGRNALCDIDIVHEFISRQHAVLFRNEKSTVIVDLKSRNGTYVNGKRVKHHVLINNDIVYLGDHRLKYVDPMTTRRVSRDGAGWDDTTLAESMRGFRKNMLRQLKSAS